MFRDIVNEHVEIRETKVRVDRLKWMNSNRRYE